MKTAMMILIGTCLLVLTFSTAECLDAFRMGKDKKQGDSCVVGSDLKDCFDKYHEVDPLTGESTEEATANLCKYCRSYIEDFVDNCYTVSEADDIKDDIAEECGGVIAGATLLSTILALLVAGTVSLN